MNNINGFTFYRSYFECIDKLPEEAQNVLLRAIVYYVYKDEEPKLDGVLSALWTVIKPNLNTSKARSQNPQKENKEKTKRKQTKTKSKQNKNNDIIDKDKELDKEINKEIDKEIEGDKEDYFSTTEKSIYTLVEQNFGRPLSPMEIEKINVWIEEYSEDIINYAIQKSVLANKRSFNYVNGILKNWKSNGYRTLQEIRDNDYSLRERPEPDPENNILFDYNWLEDIENE